MGAGQRTELCSRARALPFLPKMQSLPTRPAPNSTRAIDDLAATLGTLYRVTLSAEAGPHRRTFVGTFICVDQQGNLVLDRAVEYEFVGEGTRKGQAVGEPGRDVGTVLVPRKWWGTVERQMTPQEMDTRFKQEFAKRGAEAAESGCAPS